MCGVFPELSPNQNLRLDAPHWKPGLFYNLRPSPASLVTTWLPRESVQDNSPLKGNLSIFFARWYYTMQIKYLYNMNEIHKIEIK